MELIDYIYRAMGLTSDEVDETILQSYLDDWLLVYPENDCLAMHNTVVSMYKYLIRNAAPDNSGGGKVREKEGNVEYELDDYDKSSDWINALDSYLDAPWESFPLCRTELSGGITNRVKVGGVHEDEIRAINRNRNQRTNGASELTGIKGRRRRGTWFNSRRNY